MLDWDTYQESEITGKAICIDPSNFNDAEGGEGETSEDYGITSDLDTAWENGDYNDGDVCLCKRDTPGTASQWVFINQDFLGNFNGDCYNSCATTCMMYFAGHYWWGNDDLINSPELMNGICEIEEENPDIYTVNLVQNANDNDNTVIATINVVNGQPMPTVDVNGNDLTAPTRNGYMFYGYWLERSGGLPDEGNSYYWTDMTPETKWNYDHGGTLYAQWIPVYTVTLYQNADENDDTVNATVTVPTNWSMPSSDSNGQKLTAPTRDGYIFAGYYNARTGGDMYYKADMSAQRSWSSDTDGTLYAHWVPDEITEYKFSLTTTNLSANDTFYFSMSAAGNSMSIGATVLRYL